MKMDHETCSDLLGPYVRDELHPDTHAEVGEHLATCADCRAEAEGLRALASMTVEPLSELERARLSRTVLDEVGVPERSTKERMAWVPGALAAAAVLVALVFGVQLMSGGGSNDEARDAAGGDASMEQAIEGPRPETLTLSAERLYTSIAVTDSGAPAASGNAPPESAPEDPAFDAGDGFTKDQADRETRSDKAVVGHTKGLGYLTGLPLRRAVSERNLFGKFARAYDATDIESLRPSFLDQLTADAPNKTAADQILECDGLVNAARPVAMLPVVAAHGRHEGDRSLLLAYLSPEEPGNELIVTTFFIWPLGDCSIPSSTQFGRLGN